MSVIGCYANRRQEEAGKPVPEDDDDLPADAKLEEELAPIGLAAHLRQETVVVFISSHRSKDRLPDERSLAPAQLNSRRRARRCRRRSRDLNMRVPFGNLEES